MAALPYGPWNPAIYFTGACVLVEQGQLSSAVACIREAVRHRYPNLEDLRQEPLCKVLHGREDFEAAFEAEPVVDWAAEAEAARALRRSRAEDVFQEATAKLATSAEAQALLACLRELTEDEGILARVRDRLQDPPRSAEEIGFHPGIDDNPFERCFRFAVSELHREGRLMACEDKYSPGIFDLFRRKVELPEAAKAISRDGLDPRDYLPLVRAVEARFAEAGTPLCTMWTGGGDHLYFVAVRPETADRWVNRVIGRTHAGEPLGLCRPRWDVLFDHLGYALRWSDHKKTLPGWEPVAWKSRQS